MGILDDALNLQDAKRSQRLSVEARKSKIEANKIKEGTYRGIDLVDGTARIQLDGQSTTTSGYRLITNASLGDGDRVSIRPNGVGLPRADARNVAPKVDDVIEDVIDDIFAAVSVLGAEVFAFSGNPISGQLKSRWAFFNESNFSLIYQYKNFKFKSVENENIDISMGGGTPQADNNIDANLCSATATSTKNGLIIDVSLNAPFLALEPTAPFVTLIFYKLQFQGKDVWQKTFKKILGVDLVGNQTIEYTWSDSPIEIEVLGGITGGLLSFGGAPESSIEIQLIGNNYFITPSTFISLFPTGSTTYQFSFRFRRRVTSGDPLPWFQL